MLAQAAGSPGDPLAPTAPRPPWSFYETIGWGMIAFIATSVAKPIVVASLIAWHEWTQPGATDLHPMIPEAISTSLGAVVAAATWVGVTSIAARWRHWRFADYMALIPPRRGELIFAVAALAVVIIVTDLSSYALGRPVIPQVMIDAHNSAQTPAALVLMLIAVVVVAPIGEEIAFRGFLFRGLSLTRFRVPGAIVLTSAVWALMHGQYDGFVIVQIFATGLFFGWLRWRTGSTLLTIILHMLANLTACVQTAMKVEWMS